MIPQHLSDPATVESNLEHLLDGLTLEERCALTAGSGPWHTTPIDRAGVPSVKMTDGPIGARGDGRSGERALCLPCGSTLGATWDSDLLEELGEALGDEARTKGARVLLGPTVNLQRHPLGGRHFECYSEDPLLTGRLAVAWIKGTQSRGVGASIKHFVANDTEIDRFNVSSEVSPRALRELYLLPFEMAVAEADPWTIMAAYNRLDGTFCTQHEWLLTGLLRDEWHYDGVVVSDWGAVHDTIDTARAGLDLQMPGPGNHLGAPLVDAVRNGLVTDADVDRMARRVLKLIIRSGRLGDPEEEPERSVDRPEHRELARRAAVEGTVLLQNRGGLLPLDPNRLGCVAVVGPSAANAQLLGGGSALVRPHHQVHPLDGLVDRLGDDRVLHERGADNSTFLPPIDPSWLTSDDNPERPVLAEYFAEADGSGPRLQDRAVRAIGARYFGGNVPGIDLNRFACRWTTTIVSSTDGPHRFGIMATGRIRLLIDGEPVVDTFDGEPPPDPIAGGAPREEIGTVELERGRQHRLEPLYGREGVASPPWVQLGVELDQRADDLMTRAVEAAAGADAAIVVVGTGPDGETEGYDRADFALPGRQVELIQKVAAANSRTVVVLNAGSPIDLSWTPQVPAVVWAGFGGQEMGHALADVLLGDADPGGRLPFTLPERLEDSPAHAYYPGPPGRMPYGEDLLMGYRGFDAHDTEPHHPFGFGLSYATFDWGEPTVSELDDEQVVIEVPVTNTSDRSGTDVVQVYVRPLDATVVRPPQELKGFAKVRLDPAAVDTARIVLGRRAFAHWSPGQGEWVVDPGAFELRIGASTRDIRHALTITVE